MNWGDIQTNFSSLLNRRDATSAQKLGWLQNGIQKIQRKLRVPAMEKTINITFDGTNNPLTIPSDFLELQYILNSDGKRVEKEDITTVYQLAKSSGVPRLYVRTGSQWHFGPTPVVGDTLVLVYYAQLGTLSADSDSIPLTEIAGDLFIYAGLIYAGDFFSDRRAPGWEARFEEIGQDLQGMADADELSGASVVSPGVEFPDDHYDDF